MKRIGLIVNPIAGMGGRVGLKGTDGIEIRDKAIQLGASQEAPGIAFAALQRLEPIKENLLVFTVSGDMGENQCKALGFHFEVIHKTGHATDSSDTVAAARLMEKNAVDLIIFAGGDGTARDIYRAVADRTVVLGIPAGVKIHSPVYGKNPKAAGELARLFLSSRSLSVKEEEIVDIDEEAYRKDQMRTRLFGYLRVPFQEEYLQNRKAPTPLSEEAAQKAIAMDIIDHMEAGAYYLIAPGTTTRAVMEGIGLPNTLLGVDVIKDRILVKPDCNEKDLLDILGEQPEYSAKLIITPTGGQGYLLGRGNQQLSPAVLKKIGRQNMIILSPNSKLISLRGKPLLIDTGEEELNRILDGYYRIKIGYGEDVVYRAEAIY